ncbi:MAG: hypothetical protein HYY42_04725 [Chloroflexi bacterium]|nr:hypothetical protein [Chloroflexota bacterium]
MTRGPVAPVDRDVVIGFGVVVLTIAAALAWPLGSRFVEDAANELRLTISGAPYLGYYMGLDARDASGANAPRLMFAPGRLPGIPAVPNVAQPAFVTMGHGGWSWDGEHVLVVSAQRVYLGDRRGQLRQIADLGPDRHFIRAGWIGPDEILTVVGSPEWLTQRDRRWISRVHISAGAETPRPISQGAARVLWGADIREGHVAASPGGRWIRWGTPDTSGCREWSGLYDVENDRLSDLVDSKGRRLTAIGWLRDARLVTAFCDPAQGTIDIFLGAPESIPSAPLATLPWKPRSVIPVVDRPRDRILFAPGGGAEPATLTAIEADGRRTELGRIPAFTAYADESAFLWTLSRDGRHLSFGASRPSTTPAVAGTVPQRAGVIELATGQVTNACPDGPRGCGNLALR